MYLADMGEVSKAQYDSRSKWERSPRERKRRNQDRVRTAVGVGAGGVIGAGVGSQIGVIAGIPAGERYARRVAGPEPSRPREEDWRRHKQYDPSGGRWETRTVRTPGTGPGFENITDPKTRTRAENIHARYTSTRHPGEKENAARWLRSKGVNPDTPVTPGGTRQERVYIPGTGRYDPMADLVDDWEARARARRVDNANLMDYLRKLRTHEGVYSGARSAKAVQHFKRGALIGAGVGAVGTGALAIRAAKKKRDERYKAHQKKYYGYRRAGG